MNSVTLVTLFKSPPEQVWKDTFDEFYKSNNDYDLSRKVVLNKWKNFMKDNKPKHTDDIGFANMVENIKNTQSTLKFISARNSNMMEITKNQLEQINIDHNQYDVYHTEDCPKGIYIKENIDISPYDNIIFIDDFEFNIDSVKETFGDMVKCYLYEFPK